MDCLGDSEISLKQRNESQLPQNGLLLGEKIQKQSVSPFHTEEMNFSTTETSLKLNSQQNTHPCTTKSSFMTLPHKMKLLQENRSSLLTRIDSHVFTLPLLCPTESNPIQTNHPTRIWTSSKLLTSWKYATSSMLAPAKTLTLGASIVTPVKAATKPDMEVKTARKGPNEVFGLQPKYLCHNLWDKDSTLSPTTAEWSEMALPLPHPPLSETSNPILNKTIADNPDLFQVFTSIKVDVFESLLKNHPNPAFVQLESVCMGLCEGFWPWADTLGGDFPLQHDESCPMPKDDKQASFL